MEIPQIKQEVDGFLKAHPEALGVWVRASLSTRTLPPWVFYPSSNVVASPHSAQPDFLSPADLSGTRSRAVAINAESPQVVGYVPQVSPLENLTSRLSLRSAVVAPLLPDWQQVVVVGYEDRDLGRQPRKDGESLAKALRKVLRETRHIRETETLLKFQTAPETQEDALVSLRELAQAVAEHLDADGAKIYLASRSAEGLKLWRAVHTRDQETGVLLPYEPNRGIADYVLREQTWILIPHCEDPSPEDNEACAKAGIRQTGVNGRGDENVIVFARPAPENNPKDQKGDDEETILAYPLETNGQVTGVVTVLRARPQDENPVAPLAFDKVLDIASLANFSSHLAAACRRWLQLKKANEQSEERTRLSESLANSRSLRETYEAVAAGTGRLADAAAAVLFHFEHGKSSTEGYLYQSAVWFAEKPSSEGRHEPILLPCGSDPKIWDQPLRAALADRFGKMTFRRLLAVRMDAQAAQPSYAALALFDSSLTEVSPKPFSDTLLEHFSSSFFEAAIDLRSHVRDLASRDLDKLAGPPPKDPIGNENRGPQDPMEVLAQAADLLRSTTGADQVLIYTGNSRHLQISVSSPRQEKLKGRASIELSKTERSAVHQETYRYLDVEKARKGFNREELGKLAAALSWPTGVLSWLAVPLIHEHRSIGIVKLLTQRGGSFLGRGHEEIVQRVAGHAAWEMYKAGRQQSLEYLLALIDGSSGSQRGRHLGEVMIKVLKDWASESFFRPQASALIVVRSSRGRTLVKAGASEGVLNELEDDLGQFVARFRGPTPYWTAEEDSVLGGFSRFGVGATIERFGGPQLEGIICLGDETDSFGREDFDTLREACRLFAVIFNVERERNELTEALGRFRHAAIGPIQGIDSIARVLASYADREKVEQGRVTQLLQTLSKEAETIRLWRENQRFYLSDDIRLKVRRQALRPLVQRCFDRYKEIVELRNLSYQMHWRPRGELHLDIDSEALDVALSNLLDNAVKYAYYNREVSLNVEVAGDEVLIVIEDIGRGIKAEDMPHIFTPLMRGDPVDYLRAIPGQGLGLAMAQRIIQAHDGRLSPFSRRIGSGRNEETTPHLVRFAINLPFPFRR